MTTLRSRIVCAIQTWKEALCHRLDQATLESACFKGKAVFGPVHFEHLGWGLGINTMKTKVCTYDCLYCQVGRTPCLSTCRDSCLGAYELHGVVRKKLELLAEQGIPVEAIVFTPHGEPTLDNNLAQKIKLLREFRLPIAVITNGSLIWNDRVQEDLLFADRVFLKLDTVQEATWQALNRPHSGLRFDLFLDGIRRFSMRFRGVLVTETMLVQGVNDTPQEIQAIGRFLESIPRAVSYFKVPTLPPADARTQPPDRCAFARLRQEIGSIRASQELFEGHEAPFFGAGKWEDELIATLSARPLPESSVQQFVTSRSGETAQLECLISQGTLTRVVYHAVPFLAIHPHSV